MAVVLDVHLPELDGPGAARQIRDATGVCIAPDALDKLFRDFARVGDLAAPGTGLGLSISKQLVEALGGRPASPWPGH